MLAHAPRLSNSGNVAEPCPGPLRLRERPAMRRGRRIAETLESFSGMIEHNGARAPVAERRVGERRAERGERRLVVALAEAQGP